MSKVQQNKKKLPRKNPLAKRVVRQPRQQKSQSVTNQQTPLLKKLAEGLGNAILPGVGGTVADSLYDTGSSLLKSIIGAGDYRVDENSIVSNSVPQFATANRSIRVAHREYIKDIVSSDIAGKFRSDSFRINVADSVTFPWLSALATNYQEYKVHGMVFEFVSTSADALNNVNTALGTVVMATQYDFSDAVFTNKRQMEQYEFCSTGKPSVSLMHAVECSMEESPLNVLYIEHDGLYNPRDYRFYNLGRFNIATVGLQGTQVNVGELWVTYDIELLKPKIAKFSTTGTIHRQITFPIDDEPFTGTSWTQQGDSSLFNMMDISKDSVTFHPEFYGRVLMIYDLDNDSTTTGLTTSVSGKATIVNDFAGGDASFGTIGVGSATFQWVVDVDGGGVCSVSGLVSVNSADADLWIISLKGDY